MMFSFLFALVAFSLLEVASKPLLATVPAFSLTTQRFMFGFLFLLAFTFVRRQWGSILALPPRRLAGLALLGVLNISFSMYMLQLAVQHTSAATAAVVFCSNPLFVFLWAWVFQQEAFSFDRLLALLLGLCGTVAITWSKGLDFDVGALYALLAALSFGLYSVLGKRLAHGIPPAAANATSFLLAVIINSTILFCAGKPLTPPDVLLNDGTLLGLWIFLGAVVSGLGYIAFFNVLQNFRATSASFIFFLKPLLATLFAFGFLGEQPTGGLYVGLGLIGTASLLLIRARRHPSPA